MWMKISDRKLNGITILTELNSTGVVTFNGKPFLWHHNWTNSTKLAQTLHGHFLTNTGKKKCLHGRGLNQRRSSMTLSYRIMLQELSIWAVDPYTSNIFWQTQSRQSKSKVNSWRLDLTPTPKIALKIPKSAKKRLQIWPNQKENDRVSLQKQKLIVYIIRFKKCF